MHDDMTEDLPWFLDDAEARHAAHPDTFYIPELHERENIKPGQFAQLIFDSEDGGERMWVKVTEVTENGYIGELNNDPIFLEIELGEPVAFEPRHVINIIDPDA
jgi:hypothetical protein